jgi:transmembrane sensor
MVIRGKSLPSKSSAVAEAAAWFAQLRTGPLSESDAAEFASWLRADSSHTEAWVSFDQLWEGLETVRNDPRIMAMRTQARQRAARRRVLRTTWRASAAFAASFILCTGWWGIQNRMTPVARLATLARPMFPPALLRDASTDIGESAVLTLSDGSRVTLNTASAVHAEYTGHERRVNSYSGRGIFQRDEGYDASFYRLCGVETDYCVGNRV